MGDHRIDDSILIEAVEAMKKHKHVAAEAARALKLNRRTFIDRLAAAKRRGLDPDADQSDASESPAFMKRQIKRLEGELRKAQELVLDHAAIKRIVTGGATEADTLSTPAWLSKPYSGKGNFGVPTLFVSDLHWGEVVDAKQIGGVNKYNMTIARSRLQQLHDGAIRLLTILSPEKKYDGIVVPLGGDMISGSIHDELMATNEMNTMPTVLDLFSELSGFILSMADNFGKVFLPCVTGNHGRDTRKIWAKDRHHTSFDWLLYQFLAKHFAKDTRIRFMIPDGPDAYYKIYDHRYLLSHGDQARGGDGVIGILGPLIRTDYKKRSRNAQIGMEYDTLLVGHFHQHIQLTKLIVNGSLKGMDEYAWAGNFPYEQPQQALWVTHHKHGITYRMPVYVDQHKNASKNSKAGWVSIK